MNIYNSNCTPITLAVISLASFMQACSFGVTELTPLEKCDLLAADPFDNQRRTEASTTIDELAAHADEAISICGKAADEAENANAQGRAVYQLGRAFIAAGRQGRAMEALRIGSELNYPPAQTLWVLTALGDDFDADSAFFYVEYLAYAADNNYQPAKNLIDFALTSDLANTSPPVNFDSFTRPEIILAAFESNNSALANVSTQGYLADHLTDATLSLYITGMTETFDSLFICGVSSVPGLNASVKRYKLEKITSRVLNETRGVIDDGLTIVKEIAVSKSKSERTLKTTVQELVVTYAANKQAESAIYEQGKKDGIVLSSLGCDSEPALRIMTGLQNFFNASVN